jgi:outer membrane protein assembly factor BamB
MYRNTVLCALLSLVLAGVGRLDAGSWPQFRGLNTGRDDSNQKLPEKIGPDTNVLWKVMLPPGHSSPVVFGDRIFVTAVRDQKLWTIGLDRETGKVLWEAEVPHETLEPIHRIGSHAQCSPATDGERVVTFFGSSGLFCHDRDGKLLWKKPMGPFKNDFGAGNSPLIEGDRVIVCQDHDTDSFLAAYNKHTGEVLWHVDRSEFPRNYCSPVIWNVGGKKQIVVAATLRVVGYDIDSGKEIWTVRGVSRTVCMTPTIGEDGTLYVAAWSAGGDAGELIRLDPYADVAAALDKNKDGSFSKDEVPDGPIKMRFSQIDRDKSETISQAEYEFFRDLFEKSRNVVMAIKPGAVGDATDTHVLWTYSKVVPFCSSPLVYRDQVFTVKDGGILSSLNARTGKPTKQGRLPATGDYYSSPVAGDGKVYFVSQPGKLTVVSAESEWQVLHTADFKEEVYGTPALLDGRIYLRTHGHLYCFGGK